jgi:signal transduction histidine kinase
VLGRLYQFQDDVNPNDILYRPVDQSSGQLGTLVDSPYHGAFEIRPPIRVSPNGSNVLLGSGDLPNALTYKNELCQVFINLIVNAAHAIETAQKADRRAGTIAIGTRAERDNICIEISDNGCGIPDSVMDKIFDPFFTTKEVGKGTGQGLALARTTIVEKHGGQITVQSAVGQGSTFTITLPIGNHDSTGNRETP